MLLRTRLFGRIYEFPDLRLLMGKANEEKSGDRLDRRPALAVGLERHSPVITHGHAAHG